MKYKYIIVGGGLAGASAVEGIRDRDKDGSILLVGREEDLPYDRPPLTKQLWKAQQTVEETCLHDRAFYESRHVELALDVEIAALDPAAKTVTDRNGQQHSYGKLLLATGAAPRRLAVPGGDLPDVCYYRTLRDYTRCREQAAAGKSAVVLGGGFIGAEMAAALKLNGVEVTMLFPSKYLGARVFPEALGRAVQAEYDRRGIRVLVGDIAVSVERKGERFLTRTRNGKQLTSDLLIVGIGVEPSTELAHAAGLTIDNGIEVNELLQTSNADVFAAGDNANFPYAALGKRMRIEHWDNARAQGRHAGANMAGAAEPFTYMPFFYSDLFDFGYEAVGEVDPRLETVAEWEQQYVTGTVYYLADGKVRGVMNCNVWDRMDAARDLIRRGAGIPESKAAME